MHAKKFAILLGFAVALEAQSISITVPSAGQSVSGYSGFSFAVSLGSGSSVARVCYVVDGYPATNPGQGSLPVIGCSITPPYSFSWNSFWILNGTHQVTATAYGSLGNVVATSAPVAFKVANSWPISCTPDMTVSTSIPTTSPWSGQPLITITETGACATDNFNWSLYIDGILEDSLSFSGPTKSTTVDTTQFTDSAHMVCLKTNDSTNQFGINGSNISSATDWCASITFANGAVPMEVRNNAHEIFLAPGATFQLSNLAVNTDGSAGSSPSYVYQSLNTPVVTASSTGLVTAVANGSGQVLTMWQACSGNDLNLNTGGLGATSATCQFFHSDIGQLINITSGNNCTPGQYRITGFLGSNGAGLDRSAGSGSACTFSTGPTREAWVFVWPTNTLPHFGGDGAVLTSYNPANSFFPHCMFSSGGIFVEQPYNISPAKDLSTGGINCLETGAAFQDLTGSESPSGSAAWYASQTASVAANQATISGFPKLKWSLTGDNFARGSTQLWGSTRGPASQWPTPAYQYVIKSWAGFGNVLWIAMADEVNSSWSGMPLQGPVTFTGSTAQSWLAGGSIVASGGTCTMNATSSFSLNGASAFIITGSATSGLNSVPGSTYGIVSRIDSSHFTFRCTSVADGTYDSSNDPGLVVEPYVAAWFSSNTDYIHHTAFKTLQTQFNAAAPGYGESWPNAGGTSCQSIANWGGNGTQSLGAITQIANHTDMYWAPQNLPYIISRESSNSLVTSNMGSWVRQNYGCFNPNLPITVLTQGTIIGSGNSGYGQQGYSVPVASIADSTITFSSPHGILNIIPGISRLSIAGSSNPDYNTDFYIVAAPDANTLTVVRAFSDFTGQGAGGTITFPDGSTKPFNSTTATGHNNCAGQGGLGCLDGDGASYAGGKDTSFPRHRGQSFTLCGVTGTGAAGLNNCGGTAATGNVFLYTAQNLSDPALAPGFHYREFPRGNSTGGTASVSPDNNYIKGRNYAVAYADLQPGWAFGSLMECIVLRCAGQRIYKWGGGQNGWVDNPTGGFSGNSTILKGVFNDNTLGNQTFINQHFENGNVVPVFHALSILSLVITRWQKYILQPALNSPDYGPLLDCAARSGSYGKIAFCFNASDGTQTRTFNLSAYATAGQQIIRNVVTPFGSVTLTTLAAGTSTDTLSLNPDDAVFYVFPIVFAAEMEQPRISVRLADVLHATKVAVRYGYDPYSFDTPVDTVVDCGTGSCTLPVDRNFGTVYYRLIYMDSSSNVLATSDVGKL